jgi:hypothetical protein
MGVEAHCSIPMLYGCRVVCGNCVLANASPNTGIASVMMAFLAFDLPWKTGAPIEAIAFAH